MPLIDRLKHLEGYIKAILALIALLPGIATIVNILPIPAQISTLVGFLFGFAGIAIVLMVVAFDTLSRTIRAAIQ